MQQASASTVALGADEAAFDAAVRACEGDALRPRTLETVQVNIGLRCNLACRHCHVLSSPKRTEEMSWPTMAAVLAAARACGARVLDITGGAPEMHPHFAAFVEAARAQGLQVMVRTNLTILLQQGMAHLPEFFAARQIHLIASLPCYLPDNVNKQRGHKVFGDSVTALQQLNALGYGTDPDKVLDLVYNPGGPALPPSEAALAAQYREYLGEHFGIRFNRLYTITNVPIGRFAEDLRRDGTMERYAQVLRDAFNPHTLEGLMCRHQVHVGWDGTLYDCDFNYAIALPAMPRRNIHDFDPRAFLQRAVATGSHCFACTAGCGSSCGGALV